MEALIELVNRFWWAVLKFLTQMSIEKSEDLKESFLFLKDLLKIVEFIFAPQASHKRITWRFLFTQKSSQDFAPLGSFKTIRDTLNAFLTVIMRCSRRYIQNVFFSSRDFTRRWFNAARLKNLCLNFCCGKAIKFSLARFQQHEGLQNLTTTKSGESIYSDEVNKTVIEVQNFHKTSINHDSKNLSNSMMRIWKIECFQSGLLNTIIYIRTVD